MLHQTRFLAVKLLSSWCLAICSISFSPLAPGGVILEEGGVILDEGGVISFFGEAVSS